MRGTALIVCNQESVLVPLSIYSSVRGIALGIVRFRFTGLTQQFSGVKRHVTAKCLNSNARDDLLPFCEMSTMSDQRSRQHSADKADCQNAEIKVGYIEGQWRIQGFGKSTFSSKTKTTDKNVVKEF